MAHSVAIGSEGLFIHLDRQSGGLTIVGMDDADGYDVLVDDRLTGIQADVGSVVRVVGLNRIVDPELAGADLDWRIGGAGAAASVPRNLNADWTVAGGNTAYISTVAGAGEEPVAAVFHCPVHGPAVGLAPGGTVTFEVMAALHRAEGRIRMLFLDAGGKQLAAHEAPIRQGFQGGARLDLYGSNTITAQAPETAAAVRLEIVKDPTREGADSFLFFTRPGLWRGDRPLPPAPAEAALPAIAVAELFRLGRDRCRLGWAPVPGEALDGQFHRLSLRSRSTGRASNAIPLALPASMASSAVIYGLEGSVLVAQVKLPPTWTAPVTIGLWIDGRPWPEPFRSEAGSGMIRLPLPAECCDGRPHLFELRLGLTGQPLGQYAAIGPVSTTPWDALQKYAGMPLPAQLAPLAAYRYRSLVAPRREGAADAPSLAELHAILLEGFARGRNVYRPLPFPRHKAPDVSIVIPVHDKFDVTYVCLAALLFAATRASFEVIVVDDGSSDTTLRLKDIAPGVVAVRHDTPQGFVGACNAGAAAARGRYIVFLNNDTEPTAGWLDELLFVFENFAGVGLAGSKLVYPDGSLQEAGGIVWETGDPWNYGRRGNASDPRYSYTRLCDYLSGAAIMIPAALWKELGGFSGEFAPAYFEDTDLAFKVRNAGKRVVFAPRSIVVHYEGLSNGTEAAAGTGLKRFQEINRPRFKRKWAALFAGNGKVGVDVDLAKDRGVARRVAFFDNEFPRLDQDAGSYAAIQEIRMFQALGCKVTFVPVNMAYLGHHTDDLQRIGVETIHLPFHVDIAEFLRARGGEFDLAYITRYGVAEQVLPLLRQHARQARTAINVADLHFLRAIRDAAASRSDGALDAALGIREAELATLGRAELVLSYSSVEQVVILSHLPRGPKTALMPWVVDARSKIRPFAARADIAFIGGYRHPPNVAAVRHFVDEIMPLLRRALPGVRFRAYGSNVPAELLALACDDVAIEGYVADVDEAFSACRVFVAPLLSGAGMKGKVLDCLAAGVPSVLSPVAAEGIDIEDGRHAAVARHPAEWAEAIVRLYTDEVAWSAMSAAARDVAARRYSFAAGVAGLMEALAAIEFFVTPDKPALHLISSRGVAPAAEAGGPRPAGIAAARSQPRGR